MCLHQFTEARSQSASSGLSTAPVLTCEFSADEYYGLKCVPSNIICPNTPIPQNTIVLGDKSFKEMLMLNEAVRVEA